MSIKTSALNFLSLTATQNVRFALPCSCGHTIIFTKSSVFYGQFSYLNASNFPYKFFQLCHLKATVTLALDWNFLSCFFCHTSQHSTSEHFLEVSYVATLDGPFPNGLPVGPHPSLLDPSVSPTKILLGYLGSFRLTLLPCSSKLPVGPRSCWISRKERANSLAKTGATLLVTHVPCHLAPTIAKN